VTSERGNYLAYYDNIYGAIRKKQSLEVPAGESLLNIYIIEKAFESMLNGKVVPLEMNIL
jgi:hypothetical protein